MCRQKSLGLQLKRLRQSLKSGVVVRSPFRMHLTGTSYCSANFDGRFIHEPANIHPMASCPSCLERLSPLDRRLYVQDKTEREVWEAGRRTKEHPSWREAGTAREPCQSVLTESTTG